LPVSQQAKSLIVVDPGVLSETPKDPTSLIAIKCPISAKLVREEPLAGDDVGAEAREQALRSHCSSVPRTHPP
jgi:hypothetical protein